MYTYKITWAVAPSSITVIVGGKPFVVDSSDANFARLKDLIRARDEESIRKMFETKVDKAAFVSYAYGRVSITGDKVLFDGKPIHDVLADKLIAMYKAGDDVEHFALFIENVYHNPSNVAREELYLFLEKSNLPITDDGCFLAYRKVGHNYKSLHANPDGSYNDNSIGVVQTMDRGDVDDRRDNTCSRGLHFASLSYMPHYGTQNGSRIMIVKINPADVVSIPSDYDNAKGRCCRYEVIAEHTGGDYTSAFTKSTVYTVADIEDEFGVAYDGQRYWNKRDASGRFVAKSK